MRILGGCCWGFEAVRWLAALLLLVGLGGCAGTPPPNKCNIAVRSWHNPKPVPNDYQHEPPPPHFNDALWHAPAPVYPASLVGCPVDGTVVMRFRVSPEGAAYDIQVLEWSGSELFVKPALDYMKQPSVRFGTPPGNPRRASGPYIMHLGFRTPS